ncbi:MAG: hypothetical protein ABIJ24_00825 [Nitrospinota bacterium]|nr:cation:proton antiporter [Nitrospinota bacterium]
MHNGLNILLLIGLGVFFGIGGGKIFQKLKIPQVVGYIIVGLLLGDYVGGLFSHDIIETLTPLNSFALGMIGFIIGGELKTDLFKKYGFDLTHTHLNPSLLSICFGIDAYI